MNWLDVVVIIAAVLIGVTGLKVGAVQSAATGLGILVGITMASRLQGRLDPIFSGFIDSDNGAEIAAFIRDNRDNGFRRDGPGHGGPAYLENPDVGLAGPGGRPGNRPRNSLLPGFSAPRQYTKLPRAGYSGYDRWIGLGVIPGRQFRCGSQRTQIHSQRPGRLICSRDIGGTGLYW